MRRCVALHALIVVVAISSPGWTGLKECRADISLTDLFGKNNEATLTSGGLTFSFDKTDVLGSTFPMASAPTLDTVFVSTSGNAITFTFNPALSVSGAAAQNFDVTVIYTVTSDLPLYAAGLSFTGNVPAEIGNSSNPLANSSVTKMLSDGVNLNVFMKNDMNSVLSTQNNQSASLPDMPQMLTVTDTGNLSIPVRGGGGTGSATLNSFTNTFSAVPEPSSLVVASVSALIGVGVWWRGRKREDA